MGGVFHCSVTDHSGTAIQSNEIEIRDAIYYMEKLNIPGKLDIIKVPPIDPADFPFSFQCFDTDPSMSTWPEWLNLLSSSYWPYDWFYCDVTGAPNAQICADQSSVLPEGDHLKFLNGTMYLLNERLIESKKIAIVCKSKRKQQPIRTFARDHSEARNQEITAPLSVLPGPSGQPAKLEALTSTDQSFTLQAGSNTVGFKLKALYREPPTGVKTVWTKDGQQLPKKFCTQYSYQLPDIATWTVGGTYLLTVTSAENPNEVLRFVYNLRVIEPPAFSSPSCLSGLIYIMEGADYNVSCPIKFRSVPKSLIGVNLIEADSPAALRDRLKSDIALDPILRKLEFDFEMKKEDPTSGEVNILLYNMEDGQNFQLSAKLESSDGDSYLSSSVRVVPTPKLFKPPSGSSCTEGCDTEPYNVTCSVDPERIKLWNDQFNITYSTAWIIQGQWSSAQLDPQGIGRFIETTTDGATLTIWPRGNSASEQQSAKTNPPVEGAEPKDQEEKHGTEVSSDPNSQSLTLKQYLTETLGESRAKDLMLQCWIRLFVHSSEARFDPPPSDRVLRRVSRQYQGTSDVFDNPPRLIYDSRWETNKALVDQLTVTRTFTPDPKPASASLAWIAAVVIGVIIVVAVIALSVWLYTRDRGETYMLYDKERAHGNDPIQEMKEKEAFQTYQRHKRRFPVRKNHLAIKSLTGMPDCSGSLNAELGGLKRKGLSKRN
ncbi:unnamed protein product [Echinostoma caproni]|uniref:Bravo_FIGEY domain-containing protein n=1 Tax=Echinostoma caproni TaxID=27848 RepID=A0A183B524_9TREM|nr:unnamed protein product [Echinostoma caproni]